MLNQINLVVKPVRKTTVERQMCVWEKSGLVGRIVTVWHQDSNWLAAAAAAKSLQSCPTLCDPTDGRPPGSPVPGILQARTLEWVAISFSNAWQWKGKVQSLSHVWFLATPWTAARQAPPSMGFSRQKHWSGVPLPSPQTGLQVAKNAPTFGPSI